MEMSFEEWLRGEIDKRGWKDSEFARLSGQDTSYVSNVLNSKKKPGPEFCKGTARALELSQREVFIMAGLIDDDELSPPELRPKVARIVKLLDNLDDLALETIAVQIKTVLIPFFKAVRGEHEDEDTKRVSPGRDK